MGTNQVARSLRACLERAHSDLRAAAKYAYDANRGAALTDAALRRVTALIENATDCIVDASTTLRAESLGATPAPRPLSRPLAEVERAPRPCVTCGCASFDGCMRCGAPLCDSDCGLVHATETKGRCERPKADPLRLPLRDANGAELHIEHAASVRCERPDCPACSAKR